jgi:D-glycero-D-manno-heptose 1,7-bisphosphate phosphatase
MQRLADAECRLFLFTNQSGVGRGWFTRAAVEACNRRMLDLIGLGPDLFTDICIAIESPEDTPRYRKPSPRFIAEMIARHQLVPDRCWMVGDSPSDWEAGRAAGVHVAAIATDPRKTPAMAAARETAVAAAFPDFATWVDWLLSCDRSV